MPSGVADNKNKADPFALTEFDLADLKRRYIDAETARLNNVYRVDDVGGAEIVSRVFSGTSGDRFCGLVIPNYRPGFLNPRSYRLRRDFPDMHPRTEGPGFKEEGKYLWSKNSRSQFYYPFGYQIEWLKDTNILACFIEGEFKAMALMQVLTEAGIKALVIGIYGCNNWRGKTGTEDAPSPGKVDTRGPVNDFDDIAWKGRKVIICRDSNFRTNVQVRVGMRDLAQYVNLLCAHPYFADTPEMEGVNGLDDLAGIEGPEAVLEVLDNAQPAITQTVTPETQEERREKKEALRQLRREAAAKEDEYTTTRRRATSADFAAVSTICAELQWSDKARVGIQALVALSDGKQSFEWKYGQLYPLLRRFDEELFRAAEEREDLITEESYGLSKKRVPTKQAKKAQGKINGVVRGYLDAIDSCQDRSGIKLANTVRGTKHIDEKGNEVFEQSETTLPILSHLEEIDALAKANPSYSNRSKSIRAEEARALVGRLTTYTPVKKATLTPRREIEMAIKRAAGNIKSVIEQMRALEYEDWAIREDFKKHLPNEFFEIMFGADSSQGGDTPSHEHVADSAGDTESRSIDHLYFQAKSVPETPISNSIPIGEDIKKVSPSMQPPAPDVSNGPSVSTGDRLLDALFEDLAEGIH